MSDINSVTLTGRLCFDPQCRNTINGKQIASMSLALNRNYQDGQGKWQQATTYVDVTAYDRQAEQAAQLSKGTSLLITGRLSMRMWTDKGTGQERKKVEVIADGIKILQGRTQQQGQQSYQQQRPPQQAPQGQQPGAYRDYTDADPDTPF